MKRQIRIVPGFLVMGILVLVVLLSAACQPPSPTAEMQTLPTLTPTLPTDTSPLRPDLPKLPEKIPTQETSLVTGEVPQDLLEAIMDDVQARFDIAPDELVIAKAEAVIWNDGSLGCPQPGQFYTQALVEGYWVVLSHEGQEFDYRATEGGLFLLCEQRLPLEIGTPSAGTGQTPTR